VRAFWAAGFVGFNLSSFFLGSDMGFRKRGESPKGEYVKLLMCCWRTACWAAEALGSVKATGAWGAPKPKVAVVVLNPGAPKAPVPRGPPILGWLFPNKDACPAPRAVPNPAPSPVPRVPGPGLLPKILLPLVFVPKPRRTKDEWTVLLTQLSISYTREFLKRQSDSKLCILSVINI